MPLISGSYELATDAVRCVLPSLQEGVFPLTVRLNGQDVPDALDLSYSTWPTPHVGSVSPVSGPAFGGTHVSIHGSAFLNTSVAGELRCRFGAQEVAATFINETQIVCATPNAADAAGRIVGDFGADAAGAASAPPPRTPLVSAEGHLILGGARLVGAGYNEPLPYLRLAQAAAAGAGACLLHALPPQSLAGADFFEARFEMRISGFAEAHGLSFCYGELPERAWAESGASLGLCVLLRVAEQRIRVVLGGTTLLDVPSPVPLRGSEWRLMRISHLADARMADGGIRSAGAGGSHAGLAVELDGVVMLEGLSLGVSWQPTPRYRFGLGARSGPNPSMSEERYDVRSILILTGARAPLSCVRPEVSLNGQQYVSVANGQGGQENEFTFFGSPTLSSLMPESGPIAGLTQIRVRGDGLHGGSDYRCRFTPTHPNATADGGEDGNGDSRWAVRVTPAMLEGDELVCASSNGGESLAEAPLHPEQFQVSLNGQQYSPPLNYTVYSISVVAISPLAGPTLGKTTVTLRLSHRPPHAQHACAFRAAFNSADALGTSSPAIVTGSVGADANTVVCESPLAEGTGVVVLEYTAYNVQPVSWSHGRNFTYFGALSANPTSGPVDGATEVAVSGLAALEDALVLGCRFGSTHSPASREGASTVRCVAPASDGSQAVAEELAVTLDGHEYVTLSTPFGRYRTDDRIALAPDAGPATGGDTVVILTGFAPLPSVCEPRCFFNGSAARADVAGTVLADGSVRCVSPPELASLGTLAEDVGGYQELSVALALNGQQFVHAGPFYSYVLPNASGLVPGSGPTFGETAVSLLLPQRAPANASARSRCRFGVSETLGTLLADGMIVRCVAPSATQAAVLPRLLLAFPEAPSDYGGDDDGGDALGGGVLRGVAALVGGALALTPAVGAGSWLLTPPNPTGATLRVGFEALLGTGRGADGISFAFGPLPPTGALSEMGSLGALDGAAATGAAATGLELRIRTGDVDLLQLSHRGAVVLSRKMHGALRADAFLNVSLSVSASGLVELDAADAIVVTLQLEQWSPRPGWALAFGGRCTDSCSEPENAQWIDNVLIQAEALVERAPARLELALNGQQFVAAGTFEYTPLPSVSRVRPLHGPVEGGTRLTIHGSHLAHLPGSNIAHVPTESRCRLRNASGYDAWRLVEATRVDAATVACETPAWPAAQPAVLEASSNGQQFAAAPEEEVFIFYAAPVVETLLPTAGPAAGGSLLRLFGAGIDGGRSGERRCRLGASGESVNATLDAEMGALFCRTPALSDALLPLTVRLYVSLNARDFSDTGVDFGYFEAPLPQALTPAQGGADGLTHVLINGSGLFRSDASEPAQCRFGDSLTNASYVDAATIACLSPVASAAGAAATVFPLNSPLNTSQSQPDLRGSAQLLNSELRLTSYDPFNSGAVGAGRATAGTIVFTPPRPALPVRHFRLRFALRMGRGSGADGFSVSYGDIPSEGAVGELGVGGGLRVCMRTHTYHRLEVYVGDVLLHSAAATAIAGDEDGLRDDAFVQVEVSLSGSGLTVTHDGHAYAQALRLDGWLPRRGWRFALGARTGAGSDDHHVRELQLETGAVFTDEAVPVELTLNGQDFSESGLQFTYSPI